MANKKKSTAAPKKAKVRRLTVAERAEYRAWIAELKEELRRQIVAGKLRPPAVVRPKAKRISTKARVLPAAKAREVQRLDNPLEGIALPNTWFYRELQKLLDKAMHGNGGGVVRQPPEEFPEIDQVNFRAAAPGRPLIIEGTSFGAAQGQVHFELRPGVRELLVVTSWTETEIRGHLRDDLQGEIPQVLCELLVKRADGKTSGPWSIDFEPTWAQYFVEAKYYTYSAGFDFGVSENGIFADGVEIGGPFTIFAVDLRHEGGGWSELRTPNAHDGHFAQGYHVGLPWLQSATLTFNYRLWGPLGVTPPAIPSPAFSAWFQVWPP